MRKFRGFLLVVFLLSSGTTAATESLMPLLILGDSLSAAYGIPIPSSWPRLLATRIRESGYKYSVVNASISGETTAGGA
ncbi:MAG: arylesterase, partial [Gammaproteobacteria bacterium]